MNIIKSLNLYIILKDVMINVNPDGTSSVTPPAIITCYCALDVTYFPFDEKVCNLKWGR